jgi:hypothetical protein
VFTAPQPLAPPRTILARPELLLESRRLVDESNIYIMPAYRALIASADSALKAGPFSVMQKETVPPSGDKHDYLSMAPYWWPDTTKANGLPYIRRDGFMNPQTRIDHDGLRFGAMTDAVEALGLAYWFTGERRYADRAAFLLRTWFLNPATRMNPNLNFAQAILGVTEGRGIGILDLRAFPRLLDAMRLMEGAGSWSANDQTQFSRWLTAYLKWLLESANGKDERSQANNHGSLYDMQVAGIALYLGDSAVAREMIAVDAKAKVDSQITATGEQPLELERTRPMQYSLFNLDALTELAEMARHVGMDLWHYRGAKGGSIIGALKFIAPYADDPAKWLKPDVAPVAPDAASVALRRAGTVLGDSTFGNAGMRAAKKTGASSRELLFYPGVPVAAVQRSDLLESQALAYAFDRLKAVAASLDPSNGYPRSTLASGEWDVRPWNAWTSGFFAGALWYAYSQDKTNALRRLAERWTAGLAPARELATTHDLGFIIFNSFGHGYLITGDTSYRRTVVDASRTLANRYSSTVGAIKSWDTFGGPDARKTWEYPVIIDNLMNLEMLFRASEWGDTRWKTIAEQHALTSAAAHLRSDGSTFHVVLFNPRTGQAERGVTWQGLSDSSAWARGQAWAIYGFATAYRYTRNTKLLRASESAADFFLSHNATDGVPYWDLKHPAIPGVERDASAGAIAASGLLELARHTDQSHASRYRAAADRILRTLSAQYITRGSSLQSVLAHSVGGKPQNSEIDVGIVYADYYFIEALLRQRGFFL